MADASIVLQVENLGKQYILGGVERLNRSFREMLTDVVKAPFRRYKKLSGDASEAERFWALTDINFEIKQGEVVGIIGRNGAGKSTLLKILSRITTPTTGRVTIKGNVASLLEVGTGFHPELTGRENIYLNGAILGMKRSEITAKFDDIVAFANIEKFVDTPVKRYSSGMYVRLAFSIAAHLDPDVLIVDEVLAVGDLEFQKRCLGKLNDIASQGRTVIFVSHNMGSINRLCSRALLIEQGSVHFDGNVQEVIGKYHAQLKNDSNSSSNVIRGSGEGYIKKLTILPNAGPGSSATTVDQKIELVIQYVTPDQNDRFLLGLVVYDNQGNRLFESIDGEVINPGSRDNKIGQISQARCMIPENLLCPGEYQLGATLHIVYSGQTPHFEEFLKTVTLHEIEDRMRYKRKVLMNPVIEWVS